MAKLWIKDGVPFNGNRLVIGDTTIINPSDDQMREAGYELQTIDTSYTDAEKLAMAKNAKVAAITRYDASEKVNQFILNGNKMWLNKIDRISLKASVDVAANNEAKTFDFYYDGTAYTLPISIIDDLYQKIETYATAQFKTTEGHKAAVKALTTISEVQNYNFETGYLPVPEYNVVGDAQNGFTLETV